MSMRCLGTTLAAYCTPWAESHTDCPSVESWSLKTVSGITDPRRAEALVVSFLQRPLTQFVARLRT